MVKTLDRRRRFTCHHRLLESTRNLVATELARLSGTGVSASRAGHGSLTTTQRYLHPDQQSIIDAGRALSVHLGAS